MQSFAAHDFGLEHAFTHFPNLELTCRFSSPLQLDIGGCKEEEWLLFYCSITSYEDLIEWKCDEEHNNARQIERVDGLPNVALFPDV